MDAHLTSSYSSSFVAMSFLVSVAGAFISLSAAMAIVDAKGRISQLDLVASALALGGVGVWSMHFIGMLALQLDVGVGYSMIETGVSLVASVVSTGFALFYVARDPRSLKRLAGAGTVMGIGVGLMHYVGMYGLRFGGFITWSVPIIMGSVLIAVVAAMAALWLAFNARSVIARLGAAILMAGAVCAMHYIGMSAADFVCTTNDRLALPHGTGSSTSSALPGVGGIFSLGVILLLSIDLTIQSFLNAREPAKGR